MEKVVKVYRVRNDRKLGEGADGQIVRGELREVSDGAPTWHALKFIRSNAYDCEREIASLRALAGHPNIIDLLGVYAHNEGTRRDLSRTAIGSPLGEERGPCSMSKLSPPGRGRNAENKAWSSSPENTQTHGAHDVDNNSREGCGGACTRKAWHGVCREA